MKSNTFIHEAENYPLCNSLHFVVVIVDYRNFSNNQLKILSSGVFTGLKFFRYASLNL